jgi:inositol-phosphate transport system permease protein
MKLWKRSSIHLLMILLVLPIVLMVAWIFISSVYNYNSGQFTWGNWAFLSEELIIDGVTFPLIWPIVLNTFLFGLLITAIDLVIAVPAAYAFSRLNFKGKSFSLKFLFIMGSFPGITLLITSFFIMQYLGLLNTMFSVVILSASGMVPWHVYILKGFFDEVSWDMEFSAMMDGCTRFQSLIQVILPNLISGIGAIAIFAFMGAYGEWLLIKLFIFDNSKLTMAGYLAKLIINEDSKIYSLGVITAIGLFYSVPIGVFYLFTQSTMMKVTIGGSKGV